MGVADDEVGDACPSPRGAMKLAGAFLCDAASIREGLLNVLGAGITRIGAISLPAPLSVTVAALFELTLDETSSAHTNTVTVTRDEDKKLVAKLEAQWTVDPTGDHPEDEIFSVPFVGPLMGINVDREGTYRIALDADGERVAALTVNVILQSADAVTE